MKKRRKKQLIKMALLPNSTPLPSNKKFIEALPLYVREESSEESRLLSEESSSSSSPERLHATLVSQEKSEEFVSDLCSAPEKSEEICPSSFYTADSSTSVERSCTWEGDFQPEFPPERAPRWTEEKSEEKSICYSEEIPAILPCPPQENCLPLRDLEDLHHHLQEELHRSARKAKRAIRLEGRIIIEEVLNTKAEALEEIENSKKEYMLLATENDNDYKAEEEIEKLKVEIYRLTTIIDNLVKVVFRNAQQ